MMYFQDEPEHIQTLRTQLQRFVAAELPREKVRQWERECTFPRDVLAKLAKLGVFGLTVDEQYGGLGRDVVAAIVVIEELSKRGPVLSTPYIHSAFYGSLNISESGSEKQKRELLPKLANGEMLFAYGLSEPDVGSDLAAVKTRAELVDGGRKVRINGTKRWCTGARDVDYIYCLVRSDSEAPKYRNLSFVLIPPTATGISITDIEHMGFQYTKTTDVVFDDVEVPAENIVGGSDGWNKGWQMLVGPALDIERLELAAISVGIAHAAVEDAWNYAQERKQFGSVISAHQSVRHALADVQTQLRACEHMLYHAAWLANEGRECAVESSMAKLFVADTCLKIVLTCQQVMGAYGLSEEYDMARRLRDMACMPIIGGSSNIQRNNITNRMRLAV
jgi:alkylation response protein AidB-like acyl-CoA dehydrogenase